MFRTILPAALLLAVGCVQDQEEKPDGQGGEGDDIVDIAQGDDQFSTLASAIQDAQLEGVLRGDGPFTVFAPTNEAFEALGMDLDSLSEEDLTEILSYHVLEGEVMSDDLPRIADSVADYTLFFDTEDGVRVNDASVVEADIEASNGVVHVIDRVLMPPDLVTALGYAELGALADAVQAAPELSDTLSGPGAYTLFAPRDQAFEGASDVALRYHVIDGAIASSDVPARADTLLDNAWGYPVTALFDTGDGVEVNGVEVLTPDIRTTNGIIHVVEDVLPTPSVVDLALYAELTALLDAVDLAAGDLGATLAGDGPFTVLAPTNDAFEEVDVDALSPEQLENVLRYHVIGGERPIPSDELSGELETLLGETVAVDDLDVVQRDLHAINGVVHVIDRVLMPTP